MADVSGYIEKVRGKAPAAVGLVVREALGRPDVYFYGQLYHQKEVQALATNPPTAALLEVLRVFTYGTLADVPTLAPDAQQLITPNQLEKLKRLTLMTMAAKNRRMTYDSLFAALQVADGRELEDIVIDAITEGLIGGRIDQLARTVEITHAASRDVRLEDVARIKQALLAWSDRCSATAAQLKTIAESTKKSQDLENAITASLKEEESKVTDECKRELILAKDFGVDDGEFAAAASRGARRR
jgi:COP9 signalosome complex subunit 7